MGLQDLVDVFFDLVLGNHAEAAHRFSRLVNDAQLGSANCLHSRFLLESCGKVLGDPAAYQLSIFRSTDSQGRVAMRSWQLRTVRSRGSKLQRLHKRQGQRGCWPCSAKLAQLLRSDVRTGKG